ncbi:hypothetical protein [Nonomuraea recticatena]|uniref:Uncharacterized protein n=1 Tax=Nonomuraea recticatena TaxID=46178 RepID=A0ABN3T3R5_9ACTN
MTGWIIAVVYASGYIITARKATVMLLDDLVEHDDRVGDFVVKVIGFLLGLVWPLALLVVLVTGSLPKTDKQIRAELAARDARIAELERELGIRA